MHHAVFVGIAVQSKAGLEHLVQVEHLLKHDRRIIMLLSLTIIFKIKLQLCHYNDTSVFVQATGKNDVCLSVCLSASLHLCVSLFLVKGRFTETVHIGFSCLTGTDKR